MKHRKAQTTGAASAAVSPSRRLFHGRDCRVAAAVRSCVEQLEGRVLLSAVAGRYVFYNNSFFDRPSAANPSFSDDTAVAPDKQALLPGRTATFENYTSYSKGLNGVMVDVSGLPQGVTLTASDFEFKAGTAANPDTWFIRPSPSSVTVRRGAGAGGSDRISLVWPDGAVKNKWLQVTVKANGNTGLSDPDVFYFGNAVGETGNSAADARVNGQDLIRTRNSRLQRAPITSAFDVNRSGATVNVMDLLLVRRGLFNSIRLITAPAILPSTAVVAIDAVDATAAEPGADTGRFVVSRAGTLSRPVTVYYGIYGTATGGTDYVTLPGSVTIPAGEATAVVTVTPVDDALQEPPETVTLLIRPGFEEDFNIGQGRATVTLNDNDNTHDVVPEEGFAVRASTELHHKTFSKSVAADAAGNYVVLYSRHDAYSASSRGLYAQRYNALAEPMGDEFRVDDSFRVGGHNGGIGEGAVAVSPSGAFVAAWASADGRIFARGFDAAGVAQSDQFPVTGNPTVAGVAPVVAAAADGSFVVVWTHTRPDSSSGPGMPKVYGRLFGPDGAAVGSEFVVASTQQGGTYQQTYAPAVAMDGLGNFVVTYSNYLSFEGAAEVRAQRYDSTGRPIGGDFLVNTTRAGGDDVSSVAVDRDGNFVVVWASGRVMARRYAANGEELSIPFVVDSSAAVRADVAAAADGAFVVTFERWGGFSGSGGAFARRYGADGLPTGQTFAADGPYGDTAISGVPAVAVDPHGDFIVAWTRFRGGVNGRDEVHARRFLAANTVSLVAADPRAAEAGGDPGQFTVTRIGPTDAPLTLDLQVSGTATAGVDFDSPGASVTIPAGQASAPITLRPRDDTAAEPTEYVLLSLSPSGRYKLVDGRGTARVSIADDDRPVLAVTAADPTAAETGGDTGAFTVTRSGPTTAPLTVTLLPGGTASNGRDYETVARALVIPAGSQAATVNIRPKDDSFAEPDETVLLGVAADDAYVVDPTRNVAKVTVAASDGAVVGVVAADAAGVEGGTNAIQFDFSRTGSTSAPLTIAYALEGTATAGADFPSASGILQIPAGASSAPLVIQPSSDDAAEPLESVQVRLVAVGGYAVDPSARRAEATVTDAAWPVYEGRSASAAEPFSTLTIRGQFIPNSSHFVRFTTEAGYSVDVPARSVTATELAVAVPPYVDLGTGRISSGAVRLDIYQGVGGAAVAATIIRTFPFNFFIELPPPTSLPAGEVFLAILEAQRELAERERFSATAASSSAKAAQLASLFDDQVASLDDQIAKVKSLMDGSVTSVPMGTIAGVSGGVTTANLADMDRLMVASLRAQADVVAGGSPLDTFATAASGAPLPGPINSRTLKSRAVSAVDSTARDIDDYRRVGETAFNGVTVTFGTVAAVAAALGAGTVAAPAAAVAAGFALTWVGAQMLGGVIITGYVGASGKSMSAAEQAEWTQVRDEFAKGGLQDLALSKGHRLRGTDDFYREVLKQGGELADSSLDWEQLSDFLTETLVDVTAVPSGSFGKGATAEPGRVAVTVPGLPVPLPVTDPAGFVFRRTGGALDEPLYVRFKLSGEAIADQDYELYEGASKTHVVENEAFVEIPAGESEARLDLDALPDDRLEGREVFDLTVVNSGPSHDPERDYAVGTFAKAVGTIEDQVVTLEAADADAAEGGDTGRFTIRRTGGLWAPLDVPFNVAGSALALTDYGVRDAATGAALLNAVTIPAGQASVDVLVNPRDDGLLEEAETAGLVLVPSTRYALDPAVSSAVVTIRDQRVTVEASRSTTREGATPGRFTFRRTGGTEQPLTISYEMTGTATEGSSSDYQLKAPGTTTVLVGTATIPAAQTSVEVDLVARTDGTLEYEETAVLTLHSSNNYAVEPSGDRASVTILDARKHVKTSTVGGTGGKEFESIASSDVLLTGFAVTTTERYSQGKPIVASIKALFSNGTDSLHGTSDGEEIRVTAKSGYAVGGIVAKGSDRLSGFKVIFMRVRGLDLNPSDRYESDWIGGTHGTGSTLGDDGSKILGIHGKAGTDVDRLGLVMLKAV